MGIQISHQPTPPRLSTRQIRKTAQALLNALGSADSELSILFTDDAAIARLNRQYRLRDGPTNVLAFPMQEGDFSEIHPELLGDVVISTETTDREAKTLGISFEDRLLFLLIHGILHLFGYDHEISEAAAREMERKTEALYEWIKNNKTEDA